MKVNKRVILMTPSMSKGGAETQLLKVARALQASKHTVMIISLKPIDEFNGELGRLGIKVLFLRNWTWNAFWNIRMLYRSVRKFRPDVIVSFMFAAILCARVLKLSLRFRLISSIRISVIPAKWYVPFKYTAKLDDAVVYNSLASKLNFERRKLAIKEGLVIHNGISVPDLPENNELRTKAGEQRHSLFNWVCVGHFRWNKDYVTLFKAAALLRDKSYRITIVGELNGQLWPAQMVKDLQLENHVRLEGFKPNTSSYLADADAFVLSSFSEGMPNAILEAMAYAKPIVVTDIDGNRELLESTACGLLCKPADANSLAKQMRCIMEMDTEERLRMGGMGRAYIESDFSEEKVMGHWKDLINTLCVEYLD